MQNELTRVQSREDFVSDELVQPFLVLVTDGCVCTKMSVNKFHGGKFLGDL